jgi:hypothetical protein
MLSEHGRQWLKPVTPELLLTPNKVVTLNGLLVLIFILRSVTVQEVSYKE